MNEILNTQTRSTDYIKYRKELNSCLYYEDKNLPDDRDFTSLSDDDQENLALWCALSTLDCDFFHDWWRPIMMNGEQVKDPDCLFILRALSCASFADLNADDQMELYDNHQDLIDSVFLGLIRYHKDVLSEDAPSYLMSRVISHYLDCAIRDYDDLGAIDWRAPMHSRVRRA